MNNPPDDLKLIRIPRFSFVLLISFLACVSSKAQVVINEASYRNFTLITDSNGDNPDWIELYNNGAEAVNLGKYHLSDDRRNLNRWAFPAVSLESGRWLTVFASGKPVTFSWVDHWETAVKEEDTWKWITPGPGIPVDWMKADYNDNDWNSGQGGFGYGDGDERTVVPEGRISVFTRIRFTVTDTSKIAAALLHVDYDDGFVAYLNGTEIARANMGNEAWWYSTALSPREAIMFQGQKPEAYTLEMNLLRSIWRQGENVLAVSVHNVSEGSSDLSLRTFLSFGLLTPQNQFGSLPGWFTPGPDSDLCTNFKISSEGESIYFSDPSGNLLDSLVLPPSLPVNYSVGSKTDGSAERAVFMNGTPGKTNRTQVAYTNGYEPAPVVSHTGGFYPGSIEVTVSCDSPTAEIFYTISGQTPRINSPRYAGPVRISSNTVLKVRCFSTSDKMPGPVVTNTYFIGQEPTPAGILSLTIDNQHLYGDQGIYDNWWTDWKKPCYIEYFEPGTHQPAFKQNAGIKIEGGAGGSRSQPQRSFRIEPGNGTLGDGDVQYPLIPARANRKSYETFYIRNGSNQYLIYPCKDAIETRCMGEGTKNTYAGYTPVQVYLNGEYWGYYELREKLDEDFFRQHFDTDEDSLEILSVSYYYGGTLRAVHGTDPVARFNSDYNRFLALDTGSENFWEEAGKYFDLEYYTDYICAQSWMGNVDWPFNNIRIHRSPETGHRWRFSLVDLEWSLNPNGWSTSTFNHIEFMLNYDPGVPYLHIWQKAMENRRYRDYFINRFADLMNSSWRKELLSDITNEIFTVTRPELPATFQRWGNPNTPVSVQMSNIDVAHRTMLNELSARSNYVRSHIRSKFQLPKQVTLTLNAEPAGSGTIRVNTIRADGYPWTGIYFDGLPVQIEAIPNPGFVFGSWNSNALMKDLSNALFSDTLKQSASLTANFRQLTSSEKVMVSEINYNSETSVDAGDWVEFWNYDTEMAASLNGWFFTDSDPAQKFIFPPNTVIPPNGRLVVVRDPALFAAVHPGTDYVAGMSFGLGGSGDTVNLFNSSQVRVATVPYRDESPWPLGADGQGRTLELRSEKGYTDDPANWFDGCIGGSPGQPYSPCPGTVIFSEINYKSDQSHDHGDWVELRNIGEMAEDLSGWVFKDESDSTGHAFVLPSGTVLEAHQHLVLVQDQGKFALFNPTVTNHSGPFLFGLKETGEWIRAYDASGKLRLSVRYNNKSPWPIEANGLGFTLELVDSTGIMNDGLNWIAGCYGGSPGTWRTSPCSSGMNPDELGLLEVKAYPNPTSGSLMVITGPGLPARLLLQNLMGSTLLSVTAPTGTRELHLESFPKGMYLLTVQMACGGRKVIRVVKE